MKHLRTSWLWLLILPIFAYAQISIPPRPTGFVNDYANLMTADQRTKVEQLCKSLETQLDGLEFAVVTIPSLNDNTIDDVAVRWFENWKIGKKGKDNGLLLMVAPKERKIRIEVGYGLEPILPDAVVGEFRDRGFVNTFRLTQNYGDAIYNTVSMFGMRIAKMEGKKLDGVQMMAVRPVRSTHRSQNLIWIIVLIIVILFRVGRMFWFPFGGFGGGGFGGSGGGFMGGGSSGGFGGFGGGGFGGFGGGSSGGGGASGSY